MVFKRGMKCRLVIFLMKNLNLNEDKLSIQFEKPGKKVVEEIQNDSLNLVLLDHQLLKNNPPLRMNMQNVKT